MTGRIPTTLCGDAFAVRTQALTKRFKRDVALDELELTVPDGAFYVLIGPNGAGKTTAFKILLDLIRATSGTAQVLGYDPAQRGADVRSLIGYVPEQSGDLYTWLTARRALDFHAAYYPTWDREYAARLVRELGIKERRLARLSKGEVRRLQLVMALAHRPPLLLLDEPTDGLDPVGRDVLFGILADHIASTSTTVVLSTHLVFEAEKLADHIGVLRNGRLVAQLTTAHLQSWLNRYTVSAPASWTTPQRVQVIWRNGSERERACTIWGEQRAIESELAASGAEVRQVRPVSLQEAAVALLSSQE